VVASAHALIGNWKTRLIRATKQARDLSQINELKGSHGPQFFLREQEDGSRNFRRKKSAPRCLTQQLWKKCRVRARFVNEGSSRRIGDAGGGYYLRPRTPSEVRTYLVVGSVGAVAGALLSVEEDSVELLFLL
jgi:hypothetical protein